MNKLLKNTDRRPSTIRSLSTSIPPPYPINIMVFQKSSQKKTKRFSAEPRP